MKDSPWLQVRDRRDNYCSVFLSFGNKHSLIRLPANQVDLQCKRLLINSIRRYINHRTQVIKRYGGHKSPKVLTALNHLNYAFNGSTNKWSLADLPRIIKNWESQLIEIAPGPKSKYYKNQTQFLFDLIAWANHQTSTCNGAH